MNTNPSLAAASPRAPQFGRWMIGSDDEIEPRRVTECRRREQPVLEYRLGLTPKNAAARSPGRATLPVSTEPMCASRRVEMAGFDG